MAGNDEGHADLAEPFVAHTDDRRLGHGRMRVENPLDLGWIGVEPTDEEHVFLAVRDGKTSVLVEPADVAGVQPAVGVDGLRGGRRILEVALHDVVTPQQHLPVLARLQGAARVVGQAQLRTGGRTPGCRRDRLEVIEPVAARAHRRSLGKTVARGEVPDPQFVP